MPASVDYTTEDAFGPYLDDNFTDEVLLYLGLDPSVGREHLPLDIEAELRVAFVTVEKIQWRNILPKTVTLQLPHRKLCTRDGKIYLPYGDVSSLTTFTYTDTDGDSNAISSANYTLYTNAPASVWAENWSSLASDIDTELPFPITITYTAGYSAFSSIPKTTLQAIKILTRHNFDNRSVLGDDTMYPQAFEFYVDIDSLRTYRAFSDKE